MPTARSLQGRHVIITGAGTGIGRAIALRLAGEGAAVSLMGRRLGPLNETGAQLAGAWGAYTCDIRQRDEVDASFASAAAAHGPVYALIANAGVGGANEPGEADRFEDIVGTNLTGTYWCLRAAQRHLAAGPDPRHLVVIASILGRFGVPGYTGYCASKTGLFGLVRAMAMEVAADNVQVNAVAPGWVETQMAKDGIAGMAQGMGLTYEAAYAAAMEAVPMGRMSQPKHIAGLVSWLLSEDGVGVTGQGIDMNNGAWMG